MALSRLEEYAEFEMDLFSELRDLKVLLVDNDEWIRHSLCLFFEGEGCHILAIETAEEGMEIVKKESFDVIIADYRLPGMNGLDFLRLIQGSSPGARKILVTAYGNEELIASAQKTGIDGFIRKPFTSKALVESLRGLSRGHWEIPQSAGKGLLEKD